MNFDVANQNDSFVPSLAGCFGSIYLLKKTKWHGKLFRFFYCTVIKVSQSLATQQNYAGNEVFKCYKQHGHIFIINLVDDFIRALK